METQIKRQMKLFALNSNRPLAEKIAEYLDMPLGQLSSRQFSDGEIQINIEESVRGVDVFIVQSTSYPVNVHLWELLIMVDACKRASAATVNLVIPYFGYARQDRIASSREPITAKLVANMLVKSGIDRVLTLDIHADQVQGFFDIPVDNLQTIRFFADHYRSLGLHDDKIVVVSPKNSGIKRARNLATRLNSPLAIIDYDNDDASRENGYVIGDVQGKKAILIDDILNTGKTFASAATILKKEGATDIYAVATHGIFSPHCAERINAAPLTEILLTDSVNTDQIAPDKIKYISVSRLLGEAAVRIFEKDPVSPLYE